MVRIAITMVRDEADIIADTLRVILGQVDHVIVADNRSTDGTRNILEGFARFAPVTVLDDPEVGYYQAQKMTRLANLAGEMGADWVIPFDADEAWYLGDLPDDADVVVADSYIYVPRPEDPAGDWISSHPWRLEQPQEHHKVCFRYHPSAVLHMGQHNVDRPGRRSNGAHIRHYPYRSLEQVRRKVTNGVEAYNATNLSTTYGAHWRELAARDDLEAWWANWISQPVVFDPI